MCGTQSDPRTQYIMSLARDVRTDSQSCPAAQGTGRTARAASSGKGKR